MINLLRNTISSFRALFGNAAANAFIQATGLTGSVQKAAITQLCIDLQASGLWDKMKAVYPMVTDNYNLLSYTEDFSNAVWIPLNVSISANTTTSPTGTNTADSFISAASSNAHPLICLYTTSGTVTYSLYVKKNNSRYVSLKNVGGITNWAGAIYDLDNVSVTKTDFSTQTSVSASIQDIGNGWRRLSLTSSGSFTDFSIQYSPNGTASFGNYGDITSTGTGLTDYYIWGAQLQIGALSTYQPILTTPSAFMASQMKYNLKDARDLDAAFRLTWSGGWTYSATGATPNGTNAYADTNLIPNNILSQNNKHISSYVRTIAANSLIGVGSSGAGNLDQIVDTGGTLYSNLSSSFASASVASKTGLYLVRRITSTTANTFINNVASFTDNQTSTGQSTNTITISARNLGYTKDFYSTSQNSFATIGNGLTDAEAASLYTIVQKYQTSLSRQV